MRPRIAAATWGKTRIEALSDGVFAIALTLLVLDIRIPELPHPVSNADAWGAIAALGPMLMSVLITFVLGGAFWLFHHATFHSIKYITRGISTINIIFLLLVSLLPFSTSLIGKLGPNHPVALAVYFTNQLGLGLVLNALWLYAGRHDLIERPLPDPVMRFMIGVQPLACVAAAGTILVEPRASYYAFAGVLIISRRIARSRYKPLPADAPAPL